MVLNDADNKMADTEMKLSLKSDNGCLFRTYVFLCHLTLRQTRQESKRERLGGFLSYSTTFPDSLLAENTLNDSPFG